MRRVVACALVVGVCVGIVSALWLSAFANPDASCSADPNALRLFPSTIDIACVPGSSWDEWQGRTVLVTDGPFEGRTGVVQATSRDLVKVAFPPGTDGLWLRDGQLELVGDWWAHMSHAWREMPRW